MTDFAPPLSIGPNEVVEVDPEFEKACYNRLSNFGKAPAWKITRSYLTKDNSFGKILRSELEVTEIGFEGMVGRSVCWTDKDGDLTVAFAIGLPMDPLPL